MTRSPGGGSASVADGAAGREALARLYDLDLLEDPGDLDLYLAVAARTGGPIVELAVGSGRLAVPIAATGTDVVGVDLDPAMLARARRRADAAGAEASRRLELVEADLVGLRHPRAGTFALAILALNSLLLLGSRSAQRDAVATMARLLRPGGVAVVDVWLPDAEDLARFDGRLVLEYLRTDPETGLEVAKTAAAWHDHASARVTLATMYEEAEPGGTPCRWTRTDLLRLVGADELAAFAGEAGLVVETLAGDYDLRAMGPGSDRAILVAVRPGGA